MSEHALYYPYIHIGDVNWLKATLLLFSQVRRMVPELFTPSDDPAVSEFARHFNKQGEYLLRAAAVWEERAVQAQQWLADKLRCDGQDPAFIERFGVQSAWSTFVADDPFGFQVHVRKLTPELQETLQTTWLISRESHMTGTPSMWQCTRASAKWSCRYWRLRRADRGAARSKHVDSRTLRHRCHWSTRMSIPSAWTSDKRFTGLSCNSGALQSLLRCNAMEQNS